MNIARYMMIFSACAAFAGCTSPVGSADGSAEDVGDAQEAWDETTCGAATACAQNYSGAFCNKSFGIESENYWASPDNNYGFSSCVHGFVVEVTVEDATFAAAGWDDTLPTNSTDCANSSVSVVVWNTATGAFLGQKNLTGTWSSGVCFLDTTDTVTIPAGVTANIVSTAYTYTWVSTPILHKVYSYKLVQPTVFL